jgi:hypothetical protein
MKKKTHNMLSLILYPRFKSFCLTSSFIGCEQRVTIVEEHNERSSYPMFLKSCHHLRPMVGFENEFVEQIVNVDYSLDIFEMTLRQVSHQKIFSKESF